jgi:Big-like domain-containing protein
VTEQWHHLKVTEGGAVVSNIRKYSGAWLCWSGAVGAAVLGAAGCANTSAEDCTKTHSCAPASPVAGDAGAAGEPSNVVGGGSAGGDANGSAGGNNAGGDNAGSNSEGEGGASGQLPSDGNAPPRVISITPAHGAEGQPLDATVVVKFSEPLDSDTVSAKTFKVTMATSRFRARSS